MTGCEVHDGFFGQLISGQFPGDTSFVHNQYAIAHADDFLHFAADKQDGDALRGELVHELVDFLFGTDVNSAGWFVEEEHFGFESQPLAEDDFLLISSGEVSHAVGIIRRFYPELPAHVSGLRFFDVEIQ